MFFSQGSPPFPSRVVFCTKRSPHRVLWGHILHLGRPHTHTPPSGCFRAGSGTEERHNLGVLPGHILHPVDSPPRVL